MSTIYEYDGSDRRAAEREDFHARASVNGDPVCGHEECSAWWNDELGYVTMCEREDIRLNDAGARL